MFRDRLDAGRRLGKRLLSLQSSDVVVLGLPRGGVPVAFEVATVLGAPLDAVVVRKLGVSFQPELAMGAIGEDGAQVLNLEVLALIGVDQSQFAAIARRERAELERRESRYRNARPPISLDGRTDGRRSSLTTASPPARRPEWRARWPGRGARHGWCWRCPWRPRRRLQN